MKKFLTILLVAVMAITCFACTPAESPSPSTTPTTTPSTSTTPTTTPTAAPVEPLPAPTWTPTAGSDVIIGSTTELGGSDFANTMWGNNAADADIRTLTNGYATVQLTSAGEYVWDTEVTVRNYDITANADGTKTFTIELNRGLTYSDGTPITAKDYVVMALISASPVVLDADIDAQGSTSYVGQAAYAAYTGEGAPVPFSGIRLIDEYTFSYTMIADLFPYYYEISYAAFSPSPVSVWLGDGVEICDDGEGAYLTSAWYAKDGEGKYAKAAQLTAARYNWDANRPVSGPYKFVEWNATEKKVTLEANLKYHGNYEGQTPDIERIAYIKLIDDTMFDQFKTGGVDIISGVSGGDSINAGLTYCAESNGAASYTAYLRAGYGKLQINGDYSPTQFKAVRQALSTLLDKVTFAETYTGGFGQLVKGPYGLSSWMYQEAEDYLEETLKAYEFSVDDAIELLEADGWVYNADGTAYTGTGVRYKKLTAEEAAINDNANYECGNSEYATVKVGNDYYMPLALHWGCTPPAENPVVELLIPMLQEAPTTTQAGMVIIRDEMDFTTMLSNMYRMGTYSEPSHSFFNLATGFTSPIYDYAGYWMTKYSKSNVIYAGVAPAENATFTEADKDLYTAEEQAAIEGTWTLYMSQGNCGFHADKTMDELTWDMVYTATTKEEYLEYWKDYIVAWNEYVPEIPLYSDLYHDFYNSSKIGNYVVNPYWSTADAILYCTAE